MTAAGISDEGHRVALAVGALVLGAIAMGASVLFVRWADVGPYASAFWRVFLALPFLWIWMRWEKRPAKAPRVSIFLEAIAAGSFGWLLLNEPLGFVQAFGGVLILFGIWIARPRAGERVEVGL
jgi:drug/metabolite transporter (DMT)-like permease